MKTSLLLRLSAILLFLHDVGHTFGALNWKHATDTTMAGIIAAMQNNHFMFMGRSASLAAFYDGYGISMIFMLLLLSVLLWMLAGDSGNAVTKKLLLPLTGFLGILAVLEYIYFFPFAALFTALAGVFAFFAILRLRQSDPGRQGEV
jgi:hypothetical protein